MGRLTLSARSIGANVVVVGGLLALLVSGLPAPAQAADPPATPSPSLLEGSPEGPVAEPTPTGPKAASGEGLRVSREAAVAAVEAADTGERVEIVAARTEKETIFVNPDGTRTAEISPMPVRIRDDDGAWQDVDSTLELQPDGTIATVATPTEVVLSGGGDEPLVRVTEDDEWVSMDWPDALPAPVLDGDTATYPEVLPGVDLVVKAGWSGFSQYLVVKTPEAAANPALETLTFPIQTSDGLEASEDERGGLTVQDAGGTPAFTGPAPRMWESAEPPPAAPEPAASGPTASPDASSADVPPATPSADGAQASAGAAPEDAAESPQQAEPAPATPASELPSAEVVVQEPGEDDAVLDVTVEDDAITMSPDQELLTDPDTVFPVVIDPSVASYKAAWYMVWSNGYDFYNHPDDESVRVGYDGWSGQDKKSRVFFSMPTATFRGTEVLSAVFAHRQVHSPNHNCNLSSFGPGVELWRSDVIKQTGWPGPAMRMYLGVNNRAHGDRNSGCNNPVHTEWNVLPAAADTAANGWSTITLGMKSADETDMNGWRQFENRSSTSPRYPVLSVTYNRIPKIPTELRTSSPAMACDAGQTRPFTADNAPIVWADVRDPDPENVQLKVEYQRIAPDGPWNGLYAPFQAQGDIGIPMPALADGSYRWRANAFDGKRWSGWTPHPCEFTVDTTRPNRAPTITSAQYPEEEWAGGEGQPGTFTFGANGVTDIKAYRYSLNSDGLSSTVKTSTLGGNASITLTPDGFGPNTLYVQSIDRANNPSPVATYVFKVGGTEPVAVWRMNEGSGTTVTDETGGGNTLTVGTNQPGQPSAWGSDWRGSAYPAHHSLVFSILPFNDANRRPKLTGAPVLRSDVPGYTVAAWVRLTGATENRTAVSHDGVNRSAFRLGFSASTGNWAAYGAVSDTTSSQAVVAPAGSAALNTWTHLAAVYSKSGRTFQLYVNGELAGQVNNWTTSHPLNGPMRIGGAQLSGSGTETWTGEVDDVRVFPGALGAPSIRRVMNDSQGTPDPLRTVTAPGVARVDMEPGSDANFGTVNPPTTPPSTRTSPAWPVAAAATVRLQTQPVPVPGLPLTVTASTTAEAVEADTDLRVRTLDQTAAQGADVPGVLMQVTPDDPEVELSGDVRVSVDYEGFDQDAADYGSRLTLYQVTPCEPVTDPVQICELTPVDGVVNDVAEHTLSGDVRVDGRAMFAAAAGPSGSTGDFKASSLAPSSSWSAGGSAGDFTWSYPLRVPPTAGGLNPQLAIQYSSASVDGRITSTNNQTSWVGEGHSLEPGFIERRYAGCADDRGTGANNTKKTGDLCWKTDTVFMSLNGTTTEMIRDGNQWRPVDDDGSRIEHLTGGSNGDNDGEYWRVTTANGTQYYFGMHKRDAADEAPTWSTYTVPVAGNHAGEPCHATAFADSFCNQAWRWNLAYIVDPNGNAITYTYAREVNRYGQNLDDVSVLYTRGGYLSMIEYGERHGTAHTTTAPARVLFTTAERCLPTSSFNCAVTNLTQANALKWPDVPRDQICTSTTSCTTRVSPTFFSRKRLTSVTTEVYSTDAYAPVEQWSLTHSFPDPGDGTSPALWLARISHTGLIGTDIALPDVTFQGAQMPNRVDGIDNAPPFNKWRISDVRNETGGTVSVTYTPTECAPGNVEAPESNTQNCFPVYWTPEGGSEPERHWFHKYLVARVIARDGVEGISQQTTYGYEGEPAWAYQDNELIPAKQRTWGDWRGYETVATTVGAGELSREPIRTRTTYLRGMDGDHLPGGGTRDVTVTDSEGDEIADHKHAAGFVRETISYDGDVAITKTINDPWISAATATDGDKTARMVDVGRVRTFTAILPDGGWRTTDTVNAYDQYGLLTQSNDRGDTSKTSDDLCVRNTYVRNTTAHIIDRISRTETVSIDCGDTPTRPGDVVTDQRYGYDGGAVGAAPSKGNLTRTEELDSWSSGPVYVATSTSAVDAYGRTTSTTDALDRTTTIAYINVSGGLTQTVTTTNPAGHVSSTKMTTYYGQPSTLTDANGRLTTMSYDSLGRLLRVWGPDRSQSGGESPTTEFTYTVRNNGPSAVGTKTLLPSGAYTTGYELFDGLGRPRQAQAPSPSIREPGRLVTDVKYDSRGLAVVEDGPYYVNGPPSTTLFHPDGSVPASTRTSYDGLGRVEVSGFYENNTEKWRTTTQYRGDHTLVDPPTGDTPTATYVDARGRTERLLQYHGGTPSGANDQTHYTYTPAGQLATVTDPAGNDWSYSYDLRGRQTTKNDPDSGVTDLVYDTAGQLTSTTDSENQTLAYTYDALGRKTSTRLGSVNGTQIAGWAYDTLAKGHLTSSTRYEGTAQYTTAVTGFDDAYRPTGRRVIIPSAEGDLAGTYNFTTTYNPDGSVATTRLPAMADQEAEKLNYRYDAAGQPDWMYGFNTYTSDTIWSPYGEVMRRGQGQYGAASWQTYEYEVGTRRLARARVDREGEAVDTDTRYRYDTAGNVTGIFDQPSGGTADLQCFTYDYLRRLTRAYTATATNCATTDLPPASGTSTKYSHTYTYDLTGNRTSMTTTRANATAGQPAVNTVTNYVYPAPGAEQPHTLTRSTTGTVNTHFTYDNAGNTLTAGTRSYTWDAEGKMATATASGNSSFVYTADGDQLIRRGTASTVILLPGHELIRNNTTGAITARRHYSFAGDTVAVRANGQLRDFYTDQQGTIHTSIDSDGGAYTHSPREPFGTQRGAIPSGAAWPTTLSLHGGQYDAGTGLVQMGARAYSPITGRFLSLDPLADPTNPQTLHGYAYANNNPTTYTDPTGLIYDMASESTGGCGGYQYCTSNQSPSPTQSKPTTGANLNGGTTTTGHTGTNTGYQRPSPQPSHNDDDDDGGGLWGWAKDTASAVGNAVKEGTVFVARTVNTYVVQPTINDATGCILRGQASGCFWTVMTFLPGVGFVAKTGLRAATVAAKQGLRTSDEVATAAKTCLRSFTGATLVLMADGTKKAIADVDVGDQVIATDPETGEQAAKTVTHVWVHDDTVVDLTVDGERISTTEDHPFWNATDREFQNAADIDPGERVLTANGALLTVTGLQPSTTRTAPAYNLTVENIHTYHVGAREVLVHNACGDLSTPSVSRGRLQNIVDNLYKGTTNPNRVGNGTTMDAIRHEAATGLPTGGRMHTTKGQESLRGLENWLHRNPRAPQHDRLVAQSLADELREVLP